MDFLNELIEIEFKISQIPIPPIELNEIAQKH